MLDSVGVLQSSRTDLNRYKKVFAVDTPLKTLAEALNGADVFLGLSKGNVMTAEMLASMAKNPIVFAMANPTPEISYEIAMATRKDLIFYDSYCLMFVVSSKVLAFCLEPGLKSIQNPTRISRDGQR